MRKHPVFIVKGLQTLNNKFQHSQPTPTVELTKSNDIGLVDRKLLIGMSN